jgi:oxygen-dependent protoporphyrinogen oxidase
MVRIAVVGAGISGLASAWFLRSQDHSPATEIHLFEASNRIGGVIDTLELPLNTNHPNSDLLVSSDLLVECGADNFATLLPDALNLVREMGLESQFITPQKDFRIAQVVRKGKLIPIPNGFSLMQPTRMGAILATPILSPLGKLRVLR